MANYGHPGGQFPPPEGGDPETERQIQEEYRRRQAMQSGGIMSGPPQVRQPDAYSQPHHFGMMQPGDGANSPYAYLPGSGGTPHHASPYARMPYGGMPDGRGGYQPHPGPGGANQPSGNDPMAAQMYAAQQRRAQIASSYGYAGPRGYEPQFYGMQPGSYPRGDYGGAHQQHDMSQGYQSHMQDPYAPMNASSKSPPSGYDNVGMQGEDFNDPHADLIDGGKGKKIIKPKKQMLQKVTTSIGRPKNTARLVIRDGATIVEDGDENWYTGCIPLGLDDDKYWLSELQVYLRAHFAEAFGATEEDIAAPMHGRNKPIALGQVGIRCMHCKHDNPAERGQQATSYPSLISGVYNSVQQMLRLHLDCCLSMPPEVRNKIEQLKVSCSSRGGRKQYWIDSAKRLGLMDTPHGIHFGRDPQGPLPPLSGPSVNSKEGRITKKKSPPKTEVVEYHSHVEDVEPEDVVMAVPPPVDNRPLVFPEDLPLISDYLYLTLEQMAPCALMEADRVGCYKTRKVGFPGLACKHCVGQAGCGRYFPASEASLSQTTTSQTIMNHVRNCRRCPIEIRENLEIMKRNRMGPDGKRSDKPKHGGRKVFFHRLWCRMQGLPMDDDAAEPQTKKRTGSKTKKRRTTDDSDEDEGDYAEEVEEMESDEGGDEEETKPKAKRKGATDSKDKPNPWVAGCVRLTKTDDQNWLSEMECFARSDLVEVFSHSTDDDLQGCGGRKVPAVGQVGVRCVFCKLLDVTERPGNCVHFPDSLSDIQDKTADLIRLHFPSCPALPDEARDTFRKYKGFDAKVANDDSQQYWVDAARDIGLMNLPPQGSRDQGAWGITFRRDPLEPSPADELDLEKTSETPIDLGANSLVQEEDRGTCTDQVFLLLRQVRPCRFRKSDRRSGPGARGRDRSMGFPGLCCMHCVGRNTLGRYFPVSAKNLTDNTTNTLLSHVATCVACPEPIKASLAYLSHRSILQKAELSGSWKKAFFQKVWNVLHVDRDWTSLDDEALNEEDHEEGAEDDEQEGDEIEEGKEPGNNQMNALIKAAAIWLTNQDAASDKGGRKARATAKKGGAPAEKEEQEEEADDGGRKTRSSNKKRRVHT